MAGRTTTDSLFEAAYHDLCRTARGLRGVAGMPDPSALVHEAYLRFRKRRFAVGDERRQVLDEFRFVMVLAMRTVARDRRRRESARKRGGGRVLVALEEIGRRGGAQLDARGQDDLSALREVMQRLAEDRPEWFAVLAHHDFAGRSIGETARRMGIGEASVRSYRRSGLRWLRDALGAVGAGR